jgi:UDP-4-amino-4-deoxy-L-arabinose formyltransferase/UDP-glucuronic acid dehydrogenase (UDP-4-keto-hexauronic acid decarboxylating)
MRVAIIGRTEILYDTAVQLQAAGHEIVCILTAKEAPEYQRGAKDFRALAGQWAVPFASSARIREHRGFLAQARADIAVSINYSGVIPEEITALFPLGILNAHGGDLPRYRGNACQAWAILNGEEKVGLCIHRMIGDELDSGDILARTYLPIDINTTIGQAMDWIGSVTPGLFVDTLEQLRRDPGFILERQPKDPALALRCYPRRPEDGRIDWRKPAVDVLRLINASGKPYAGAFCDFEGQKLIVWRAELVEDGEVFCAVPGQVTALGEGFVDVACGRGKVRIREAEVDGRSEAPRTWIQSIRKRLT